MRRKRTLKVVLVVVGLLFCAAVFPLILMAKQDPALAMMNEPLRDARRLLAARIPQSDRPLGSCVRVLVLDAEVQLASRKFAACLGVGDVKKYYSKFDVAVVVK